MKSGWGRVDTYAAAEAVPGAGELWGTVVDTSTYFPVAGAQDEA
jgi:hypothetical protein